MIVYVGTGIAHLYFVLNLLAVNKEELMETITVGAEKIINTNDEWVRALPVSCIYLSLIYIILAWWPMMISIPSFNVVKNVQSS